MAALGRAVALAEVDAGPVGVEQDLDLDVPRALDEAFEDQAVVVECREGLPAGAREGVVESRRLADRPHALAATARGRLDEQRVADPLRGTAERGVGLVGAVVAGDRRDAELPGQVARGGLVAHRPDGRRRRPDPRDARCLDGLCERGVLGEEAEARVQGVGAGAAWRHRRRRRRRGGRARVGPSVAGSMTSMPSRSAVRRIRRAISPRFAMNRRRIGSDGRIWLPTMPVGASQATWHVLPRPRAASQTRLTRQTRHASDHQPVWRAACRARSTAGRSAWSRRSAARPRSG